MVSSRRVVRPLILLASVLAMLLPVPAAAVDLPSWISSLAPPAGAQVVGKRPLFTVTLASPPPAGGLVLLLDGADLTPVAKIDGATATFRPPLPLPPGDHLLQVSVAGDDGQTLSHAVSFTSRQTGLLSQAQAGLVAGVTAERQLERKPEDATGAVREKVEVSLQPSASAVEGAWELGLSGNLRYFTQELIGVDGTAYADPNAPPEGEVNLMDYLLQLKYTGGDFGIETAVGQVQLDVTPATVSGLSRRGARVGLRWRGASVGLFDVQNESIWKFNLAGIGSDPVTHLYGATGGLKLLEDRVELKAVWVEGGEPGRTLGVSDAPGGKRGAVYGAALLTDFFSGRLRTEVEADWSRFDPDAGDDLVAKKDEAWHAKLDGAWGMLTYQGLYERVGRNYASVASTGVQGDREGWSAGVTASPGVNVVALTLARSGDNVDGDPLFARTVSWQGGVDWSLNWSQVFPVGVAWQRGVQESEDEPEGMEPAKVVTDTVTGRGTLTLAPFTLGIQVSQSRQEDESGAGVDTRSTSYALSPALALGAVNLGGGLTLTQAENMATKIRQDDWLANVTAGARFLEQRASVDVGASYQVSRAADDSVDSTRVSGTARAAYAFKLWLLEPTIALRAEYADGRDRVADTDTEEYAVFLELGASLPLTY